MITRRIMFELRVIQNCVILENCLIHFNCVQCAANTHVTFLYISRNGIQDASMHFANHLLEAN